MTELFTAVDTVLAKLVQYCVDHGLGYSYSLDKNRLIWRMKDYKSGLTLTHGITRVELGAILDPAIIAEDILARWSYVYMKR